MQCGVFCVRLLNQYISARARGSNWDGRLAHTGRAQREPQGYAGLTMCSRAGVAVGCGAREAKREALLSLYCAHVMVPFFLRARRKIEKGDHNMGAACITLWLARRAKGYILV